MTNFTIPTHFLAVPDWANGLISSPGYSQKEVKSAHGIEAVYMYCNGSGIWGGETICQCNFRHVRAVRPGLDTNGCPIARSNRF